MNKTIRVVVAAIAANFALLSGCATPVETTLADGSVAYRIDCGGNTRGMNYCFEKAGKSCGAEGYSIVGRDGTVIATSAAAETDAEAVVRGFETDRNSILIKCGS